MRLNVLSSVVHLGSEPVVGKNSIKVRIMTIESSSSGISLTTSNSLNEMWMNLPKERVHPSRFAEPLSLLRKTRSPLVAPSEKGNSC